MNIDFERYAEEWATVPAGKGRKNTIELLKLSDEKLVEKFEAIRSKEDWESRGWYRNQYKNVLDGKRVLDVGCGLGIDSITFAESGAIVTALDIARSNLEVVKRISERRQLGINTILLDRLEAIRGAYDFIWAAGSLHNAPLTLLKLEVGRLCEHLETGGRWVQLAYPKERWEREGSLPFDKWGEKTDGGKPWVEWYDLGKLLSLLWPDRFKPLLYFNFHNDDFNWFDLMKEQVGGFDLA